MFNIFRFLFIICILTNLIYSQDIGPGFNAPKTEIGFSKNYFNREFKGVTGNLDWRINALYLKTHLINSLTITVAGYVTHSNEFNRFPNRIYDQYLIGFGLSYTFLNFENFNIGASSKFLTRFSHDKSISNHHKRTENYFISIYLNSTEIDYKYVVANIWLAPTYVLDKYIDFPPNPIYKIVYRSLNNYGVSTGISVKFFDVVRIYANTIYVNDLQYNFGIGFQI